MADVRYQMTDEILVGHVYLKSLLLLKLFYFPPKVRYHYSYSMGLRAGFLMKSTIRLFFKVQTVKNVRYF